MGFLFNQRMIDETEEAYQLRMKLNKEIKKEEVEFISFLSTHPIIKERYGKLQVDIVNLKEEIKKVKTNFQDSITSLNKVINFSTTIGGKQL